MSTMGAVVEPREDCYLVTLFSDSGWRSWFCWPDGSRTPAEVVDVATGACDDRVTALAYQED